MRVEQGGTLFHPRICVLLWGGGFLAGSIHSGVAGTQAYRDFWLGAVTFEFPSPKSRWGLPGSPESLVPNPFALPSPSLSLFFYFQSLTQSHGYEAFNMKCKASAAGLKTWPHSSRCAVLVDVCHGNVLLCVC
jgi:hypothetical protein